MRVSADSESFSRRRAWRDSTCLSDARSVPAQPVSGPGRRRLPASSSCIDCVSAATPSTPNHDSSGPRSDSDQAGLPQPFAGAALVARSVAAACGFDSVRLIVMYRRTGRGQREVWCRTARPEPNWRAGSWRDAPRPDTSPQRRQHSPRPRATIGTELTAAVLRHVGRVRPAPRRKAGGPERPADWRWRHRHPTGTPPPDRRPGATGRSMRSASRSSGVHSGPTTEATSRWRLAARLPMVTG